MKNQVLIGVGYWRNLFEPTLPDPAAFMDAGWSSAERQQTLAYLQKGRILHSSMGFSWCRFRCGISEGLMGASDLTDGTYCWPEGLSHYVESHGLRLPDAIICHILAQPSFPDQLAASVSEGALCDLTWWTVQQGWNSSTSFLSSNEAEERSYLRNHDRGRTVFTDNSPEAEQGREQLAQMLREKLRK